MRAQKSRARDGDDRNLKFFIPGRRLVAVGAVALLAGCSSVPDAVNPVEWYKGVKGAIAGDETETAEKEGEPANRLAADRDKPAPGADEEFPKLSSVPERPNTTSAAERQRIEQGLVSERDNSRQYSEEVIRRQGDAANTLRPPAPAPAPPPPPAPVATPAPTPITPAPQVAAKPAAPIVRPAAPQLRPVSPPSTRPNITTAKPVQPKVSVPARNPNPPQLASVQPLSSGATTSDVPETVVISGSGVQNVSTGAAPSIVQGGGSTVAGVRSLSDFNPGLSQGSYQVATILFGNGSSKLRARDKRILKQVAAQHKSAGGTIRIVGHASSRSRNLDAVKHKVVNFNISAARADAVVKELIRLGTKPSNMFVGAVSDNQPKFRENMPSGEAGNRRTEIYIDF